MGKLATHNVGQPCEIPLSHEGTGPSHQHAHIVWKGESAYGSLTVAASSAAPTRNEPTATTIMDTAKPKARQDHVCTPEQRRVEKVRLRNFLDAALFAFSIDSPLNFAITITWAALVEAGEYNEGHCLGRDERHRDAYLRSELSRCRPPTPAPAPFVAIWGRDVGSRLGGHTHLAIYWPAWKHSHVLKLIALLERLTGSRRAFVNPPYLEDEVARSTCGGWQIKTIGREYRFPGTRTKPGQIYFDQRRDALGWVDYIAEQPSKHPWPAKIIGKAFGVSQSIGPRARAAHGFRTAEHARSDCTGSA